MTARIYEFPARGRFAAAEQKEETKSVADFSMPRIAKVASSGAWYHDAAVEAELKPKN